MLREEFKTPEGQKALRVCTSQSKARTKDIEQIKVGGKGINLCRPLTPPYVLACTAVSLECFTMQGLIVVNKTVISLFYKPLIVHSYVGCRTVAYSPPSLST